MIGETFQMFFNFTPRNIIIWIFLMGGMSILYLFFMPKLMNLQSIFAIRGAKKSLTKLETWSDKSKKKALEKLTNYGKPLKEIKPELEDFLEYFTIEPVSEDPSGVLERLEHILDVRKTEYENKVSRLAPEADSEELADLEMTIEGAASNYAIYKMVRHYISIIEKMGSLQLAQMLQMQLPLLEKMGEAYHKATEAFAEGKVIGDGIGAIVASKMIASNNSELEEKIKETIYAKTEIEGRKTFIIKAKGPGGRVGKPGELIKQLAGDKKPDRILMIDAGQKMEGEESGRVVEGVGAAIGGPPTEKYKIEEVSRKKNIPLDSIVIKEGLEEAITPMSKELFESAEVAVEKVKRAIRNRTEEGDTVFVAGIGNTIGVGQNSEEIPTEYPEEEKKEDELESFSIPGLGGQAGLVDDKNLSTGIFKLFRHFVRNYSSF